VRVNFRIIIIIILSCISGTRGVTVVAAGPVTEMLHVMTAGGGADLVLVTATAAGGARVGGTRAAEAENDVAATAIDHARGTAVEETVTTSRLAGTMTVKVPDTAAEVQTVEMIPTAG